MKTEILNHNQILRICNRFAFQIVENSNYNNEILIIGIKSKGYEIAKIIKKQIETIVNTEVTLKHIKIDKNNPKGSVKSDLSINDNKNEVFLIDDVLNTGKTLAYSLSYLLNYKFQSIKTLVLIDRNHKKYPIKVDFKGISLSTNIDDKVKLLDGKKDLKAVLF
tara:strand:+ start:50 stop:541 length:492 start_codon:yes stop_codon:yes gene_type:complete